MISQDNYPSDKRKYAVSLLIGAMISLFFLFLIMIVQNNELRFIVAIVLLIIMGVVLGLIGPMSDKKANEEAEQMRARINDDGFSRSDIDLDQIGSKKVDAAVKISSKTITRQEKILTEIYTEGLVQAKTSFRVGLFFACVGTILIFIGVGLAIFKSGYNDYTYASVVSGLSGAVVSFVSKMFFKQSNTTRKSCGEQGLLLREESKEDRRLDGAIRLTVSIEDKKLRDKILASMARALIVREAK